MDIEKIIFIVLAIAFSIVSMFFKSKKKQPYTHNKQAGRDFSYESDPFQSVDSDDFSMQSAIQNLQNNSNIASKKERKKQKIQNIEKKNLQSDNSQNFSQDFDLENENGLLEDFEGTELQKAFLLSEIFKNTKNQQIT
ncbi:MAG: hypothetical protein FWC10_00600 [Lentimicrobiaceae bacterium]|nr:hypothetical protein [Lentimicrobiaceae bacterium]